MTQGTPSLKMNLQLFAEDYSDFILPDETAEPQADETTIEETVTEVEDTKPTETQKDTTEHIPEQPKVKLKYNHEEKEYTLDEVVPLAQKGMNYDKVQERLKALENDPRLSFVEELAKEQGMGVNEYLDAVKQWKEQQKLDELVQKNIPEEMAKEIMENRKFREQIESERQTKAQEEKKNADYAEFVESFPNTKPEEIKAETWELVNRGIPLKYAYMQQQNQELQSQLKVMKQNEENLKKAPVGSVTAHGSEETTTDDDFLRGFDSV